MRKVIIVSVSGPSYVSVCVQGQTNFNVARTWSVHVQLHVPPASDPEAMCCSLLVWSASLLVWWLVVPVSQATEMLYMPLILFTSRLQTPQYSLTTNKRFVTIKLALPFFKGRHMAFTQQCSSCVLLANKQRMYSHPCKMRFYIISAIQNNVELFNPP